MKIAFVGNTNNYPLMLARALKKEGCEVDLFLDRKEKLHRPENKDVSLFKEKWIKDVSFLFQKDYYYFLINRRRIDFLKKINEYDFVFLNGLSISLGFFISANKFAILYTGSDLELYSSYKKLIFKKGDSRNLTKVTVQNFLLLPIVFFMRRSLKKSKFYNYFPEGFLKESDELLSRIGFTGIRTFFMLADTDSIKVIQDTSVDNTLRLVNGARLTWKKPIKRGLTELDYKGTDILLKGVYLYLRCHESTPIEITLFKKGEDIKETEKLIADLSLESLVKWKDEVSQGELYKIFQDSDIVCDQLANSIMGMVGLDAMSMGKPVIANGRPDLVYEYFKVESAVCESKTPEDVCSWLLKLQDRKFRELRSTRSREYVERCFSSRSAARKCIEIINNE